MVDQDFLPSADFKEQGFFAHRATNSPIRAFQVFGARCSGTNYLNNLLVQNLMIAPTEAYGWKHGFAQADVVQADHLIIGIVRDPLNWLKSIYEKPWHTKKKMQDLAFSDFLRHRWQTEADEIGMIGDQPTRAFQALQQDRHPIEGRAFRNVIELRTVKAQFLVGMAHRRINFALIRYEALLADKAAMIAQLSERFGLQRRGDFRDINIRLGNNFPAKVEDRPVFPGFSARDLSFIYQEADHKLENWLGYDMITRFMEGSGLIAI